MNNITLAELIEALKIKAETYGDNTPVQFMTRGGVRLDLESIRRKVNDFGTVVQIVVVG